MSIIYLTKCYLENIFLFWYHLDTEVIQMSEISSRIKKLRKVHLKLSQQEFADKLLLKRNSIAHFETGVRNPSDRTIITICETFNVNEHWLRTGEGEMFMEIPEENMFSRAAASCIKDNDITAMEGLILWRNLPPEARKNVEEYILQLSDLIKEHRNKKE